MIFATVGTNETPFDRLIAALGPLGRDEPLVVQHGPSGVRPARATCVGFLPFDELVRYVRSARAVVMHAGVGSVMVALANEKRPIVVPRLHRFGEAVDDHQLVFARRLALEGLVTLVEDPADLVEALVEPPPARRSLGAGDLLAAELRRYLGARARRLPEAAGQAG